MTIRRLDADIAVVGAGPAGLAAATAARGAGARVLVVDAFAEPGGQYYMQPPEIGGDAPAQMIEGRSAIAMARAAGAEFLTGAEIFAAYPGFRLYGTDGAGAFAVRCRAVIAACGAHDRCMAFPGWTLPGVMTPGGGQRLAKLQGLLPGQRIVLAGSGPFLWAVADGLLRKGAHVAALVEAQRPSPALALHLARHPERWREAWRLHRTVRNGVGQLIYGHLVVEARGRERVDAITIADRRGGTRRELTGIDSLLVGYGFQPAIELTSLLGCSHRFDDALGGWHAAADPATGLTDVPGVYAAGEVLGVAGARPATLSGRLAGLASAASLGFAVDPLAQEIAWRSLKRARRFADGLGRLFAPLPELASLPDDTTIVCRCEDITAGAIKAACAAGAASAHNAKLWTRAGMGRCQGRICRMTVSHLIAQATGFRVADTGFNRPRVPMRPVAVGAVLEALEEDSELRP